MKIKTRYMPYSEVINLPSYKHRKPKKPNILFRTIVRVASIPDLISARFKYEKVGMERLKRGESCLYLMNHSSFIDLKIASAMLYPKPFNIVCTSDGFVGKNWLMRNLGCIPTKKFVPEAELVSDMLYALKEKKCSVLMYPEASYSFDGTATPLPESLGRCLKLLGVPVVMINTYGAFTRDPLYNNLQVRKVKVSAKMTYLLSVEEIAEKSTKELNEILAKQFDFDNFSWQKENGVSVKEDFRADYLNRVLYKCPNCKTEGKMVGKGIHLTCGACQKKYELKENGEIEAQDGNTEFSHIPSWYKWQRECVVKEIENGSYSLDTEVDIGMLTNTKSLYMVGKGRLIHNENGFSLQSEDGNIDYKQKPLFSYSLYADYYWYEIGDMICIGNRDVLYYCFPRSSGDVVAKTRIATEEMYKLSRKKVRCKS